MRFWRRKVKADRTHDAHLKPVGTQVPPTCFVAKCACGWTGGPYGSQFASSVAVQQHRYKASLDARVPLIPIVQGSGKP